MIKFVILVSVLLERENYLMKKKLFATILLSTVALSQGAVVAGVSADSTDDKIAAQNNKINSINQQQQSAQAQVDQIQGQVSEIKKQQADLQAENDRLNEESEKLSAEIDELSKNIVARQESLANQARSAQTTGTATSYINAIVSSGSLTEAISRISAMNEIADANNKMQEQKRDKEDIAQKQKENNDAINTVIANKQQLEDDAQALTTKEAELKVAQLNLAAEKSTAENEKNALLQQKAEAEKAAAAAAAAEAAYRAKQQEQQAAVKASANTTLQAQVQAAAQTPATASAAQPVAQTQATAQVATVSRQTYSSSASSYPVGECTWAAKTLAPWAGDYWGNGGQWAASAAAAGFRTGSQPQVGAIACWNDGGYGHVAVVTAVQSTTSIQVSESNYLGNRSIGNYRGWFNPVNAQGTVTYIYPN